VVPGPGDQAPRQRVFIRPRARARTPYPFILRGLLRGPRPANLLLAFRRSGVPLYGAAACRALDPLSPAPTPAPCLCHRPGALGGATHRQTSSPPPVSSFFYTFRSDSSDSLIPGRPTLALTEKIKATARAIFDARTEERSAPPSSLRKETGFRLAALVTGGDGGGGGGGGCAGSELLLFIADGRVWAAALAGEWRGCAGAG
jgi:hypothetical protein